MPGFTEVRTGMLNAFETRWSALRPTWDHATQTAYPPHVRELDADEWIRLVLTNKGGRNRAVGILDEVTNLFTVDVYSRATLEKMFDVDALADDAHQALRTMDLPFGIDDFGIIPEDLPVNDKGFEHKRLGLIFRFDLPRFP